MKTTIHCTECKAAYEVSADWVGRSVTCRRCGKKFTIQKPTPPPVTEKIPLSAGQKVLASFASQRIEPIPTSPRYRWGMFGVSAVMILLPLIYVGLIGLAIHFLWWHAKYHLNWFMQTKIIVDWFFLSILYFVPLLAGGLTVLFMLKPLLFIAFGGGRHSRALNRDGEPILFEFIDRICQTVDTVPPSRIYVACDANAGASFRWGWFGLFRYRPTLYIGLPLAGALDVREFGGVLAHEFGHFRQRAGMRLFFVVGAVNNWFIRVVYQRDIFDLWLMNRAIEQRAKLPIVLWTAVCFVTIARGVMWLLMMIGHVLSGFLSREMERQADQVFARVGGSEAAISALRKLPALDAAAELIWHDLKKLYEDKRLPDDLAKLVVKTSRDLPSTIADRLRYETEQNPTAWHETHPSLRDRLEAFKSDPSPGMIHARDSATVLFADYAALCKTVTWDLYRMLLPDESILGMMKPVDHDYATPSTQSEAAKKPLDTIPFD